ncbi:MAG: TRAP transporter small permease subunit [Thiohalophilus sp.]|jgi:TRAP-type mannitol/chloroaromatic compound transport system permease small subunit
MPEIPFVLPHWLYWSGLVLFPLVTMWLFHRQPAKTEKPISLPLAYFLLISGGFIGVHRLYLRSRWSLVFIILFISILGVNQELRDSRNALSNARNHVLVDEFKLERAEKKWQEENSPEAREKVDVWKQDLTAKRKELEQLQQHSDNWHRAASWLGVIVIILILIDAVLLPSLARKRNATETLATEPGFMCPSVESEYDDSREPWAFNRWVSHLNGLAGEFVAYWSVIAVVVYYYEVIARYVFNSPTNWAHESMFLMFGMQYLLAGGFVLREGAHVRVDVIYNYFSNRGKAIVDLCTSVFFFIFVITLLVTGWTFFLDSYKVSEVSFTEWAISYWPIKFALPLGAALLLLQGIAQLIKDISVAINPASFEIKSEVRPEG